MSHQLSVREFNLAIMKPCGVPEDLQDRATAATLELGTARLPTLTLRTLARTPGEEELRRVAQRFVVHPYETIPLEDPTLGEDLTAPGGALEGDAVARVPPALVGSPA